MRSLNVSKISAETKPLNELASPRTNRRQMNRSIVAQKLDTNIDTLLGNSVDSLADLSLNSNRQEIRQFLQNRSLVNSPIKLKKALRALNNSK